MNSLTCGADTLPLGGQWSIEGERNIHPFLRRETATSQLQKDVDHTDRSAEYGRPPIPYLFSIDNKFLLRQVQCNTYNGEVSPHSRDSLRTVPRLSSLDQIWAWRHGGKIVVSVD